MYHINDIRGKAQEKRKKLETESTLSDNKYAISATLVIAKRYAIINQKPLLKISDLSADQSKNT